jgi:hypothetical protein
MSFGDQFVLWLHIGFAVFTIGPVTLAISSTPRYIRKRDVAILRYLARITIMFTVGSLLVLVLGIVLGQLRHELSKPWLTASMTLFVVALVMLALIIRDQRKAIRALEEAGAAGAAAAPVGPVVPAEVSPEPASPAVADQADQAGQAAATAAGATTATAEAGPTAAAAAGPTAPAAVAAHVASVERGRIAAMGGVVNLIWLAVLALMVWQP